MLWLIIFNEALRSSSTYRVI